MPISSLEQIELEECDVTTAEGISKTHILGKDQISETHDKIAHIIEGCKEFSENVKMQRVRNDTSDPTMKFLRNPQISRPGLKWDFTSRETRESEDGSFYAFRDDPKRLKKGSGTTAIRKWNGIRKYVYLRTRKGRVGSDANVKGAIKTGEITKYAVQTRARCAF